MQTLRPYLTPAESEPAFSQAPQVIWRTGKFEKPTSSRRSHLPSLRSAVPSLPEVSGLCSTIFDVFPLRGGPLGLAITLATCNQMASSRGSDAENKMFQVVQLS